MELRRKNHFLPQMYLKNWGNENGKVWYYSRLVSNQNVPMWSSKYPNGLAYHQHLYTHAARGDDSDEIERWLDREVETPAAAVIEKVLQDDRMAPEDWRVLTRFAFAQDIRTPARMKETLDRQHSVAPEVMEEVLNKTVADLESRSPESSTAELVVQQPEKLTEEELELSPFIVTTEPSSTDEEKAILGAEIVVGRQSWLDSVKWRMARTFKEIQTKQWTIVKPPDGMSWVTTDSPVVRLRYKSPKEYDFKGGWEMPNGSILMPVGPKHLLFRQVGQRSWQRGHILSMNLAKIFQSILIEHSHRMVFAIAPDPAVEKLLPRVVDAELYQHEKKQWEDWHEENRSHELKIRQFR